MGIPLPPTIDERLREKPAIHSLMQLGQTSYIGALRDRAAQQDYVNFYAYLHRVVDEKVGRLLRALGDAGDPRSLRSRTVIARISDHGEMGLSHGGLRQKMFNAYEETIRVPLVFSNPLLFPQATPQRRARLAGRPRADAALDRRRRARRARSTASTRAGCWPPPPSPSARRSPPPASTSAACSDARGRRPARASTCSSPTTTTRRALRGRRRPDSRTGSAACAPGASSTPRTWTRTAGRDPNTSSTTWRPTRSRRATCSSATARAHGAPTAARELPRLREMLVEEARATGTSTPGL